MEPERDDRVVAAEQLTSAGQRLDARLRLSDLEIDAMAAEFDQMRKGSEPPAVRK